jgi:hypothetical protein
VKKTAKSQFSLLGTVPDGVKIFYMTASRVTKKVDVGNTRDDPESFCALEMTASPKAVMVQVIVTAQNNFTHDGVTSRSRQYDFIMAAS